MISRGDGAITDGDRRAVTVKRSVAGNSTSHRIPAISYLKIEKIVGEQSPVELAKVPVVFSATLLQQKVIQNVRFDRPKTTIKVTPVVGGNACSPVQRVVIPQPVAPTCTDLSIGSIDAQYIQSDDTLIVRVPVQKANADVAITDHYIRLTDSL